nr:Holliday junction resolvase RecU [uncultured Cellulosilyticum sp.]
MANAGKEFEKQFKASVPKGVYILRIPDSAIGFNVEESTQRFAGKTPYDFIMYKYPNMYALELKSTSNTAISFEGKTPMIKKHQIEALRKAAACGVNAGFIFNFRKTNTTYYVSIQTFDSMTNYGMMGKSSINEKDLLDYGEAIIIPQRLKKVNYLYDLGVLFS